MVDLRFGLDLLFSFVHVCEKFNLEEYSAFCGHEKCLNLVDAFGFIFCAVQVMFRMTGMFQ